MLIVSILAMTLFLEPTPGRVTLEYAPAPVDNPLKGLVPYAGARNGSFPHSMEFNYLSFSQLVVGYDEFQWAPLDRLLNDVSNRGRQTVFRVYLEYPDKTGSIPEFLLKDGLQVHRYTAPNDGPPARNETPDYEDRNLRRAVKNFIAALGQRYDGDPRIGFITAGLLGMWGEWHTYPRSELFASREVQKEVLDAYEAAFRVTPILLRYPYADGDERYAANNNRRFGYHDDSFAWATLHTGKPDDSWFFMTQLRKAGREAEEKWKRQPIGGEIRPEAWGRVFDADPGDPRIQNFRDCVEATHATWLMDTGLFRTTPSAERVKRASEEVRRMGYEFHIPAVTIGPPSDGTLSVEIELENRGVAPFYYDWKAELALMADGKPVVTHPCKGSLTALLPGDPPREWKESLELTGVPSGEYQLALRVPNPMPQGRPLRFANAGQDRDSPGWLTITTVTVP
jgi:hypothetical protein